LFNLILPLVFPGFDGSLIALSGRLDGQMPELLDAAKEAATTVWTIADPKLLLDHRSHQRGGPDLSTKTEDFGSFGLQRRQVRPLLQTQFGCRTWSRLMAQGFCSLRLGLLEPLAHCTLADSECCGDVFLFLSVFIQL
jgi:hypothetical protein